jgi:hypothetical protein
MLSMEGNREWTWLIQDQDKIAGWPSVSPDGKWIAYTLTETEPEWEKGNLLSHQQIFIRPFPDVDEGQWLLFENGGSNPQWSPDSKELFYLGPVGLMSVSIEAAGTAVKKGKLQRLIKINPMLPYYVRPNEDRFLIIKPLRPLESVEAATENIPRKLNIVTNWFEELKEKVPVH